MTSLPEGKIVVPVWSDDGIIKAMVDDNGRIVVQLAGTDITLDVNIESSDITLPVEEQSPLTSIQAQNYGWVNADWYKQPMARGFSGVARSYLINTSTAAGWLRAESGAVPVGYIRVVEGFTMQHSDPAAQQMMAGVWNTVTYCAGVAYQACPQYTYYGESVDFTMVEGEKFFISAYVSAADKTVSGYYICRQIKVNE